jgi:methyltransferase (TIGR00027 family)
MQSSAQLWRDIAVLRGLESGRPPGERLVDDPVSLRLLPGRWRWLMRLLQSTGIADSILARRERELPGVIANLLCRTRYMDDVLRSSLDDGVEQVVILGAGFDTRPYREPDLDGVDVFEVDHPGVQSAKRQALQQSSITVPPNVTLVGIDFEQDDLGATLAQAGFRSGARTLFVWEGVTQYISRQAIEDTLSIVAGAGGPGSSLVFSYIREDVVSGTAATDAERRVMDRAEAGGAPWRTGLDPATVPALLERYGLEVVEDIGGDEYRRRYLEPAGRRLTTLRAERVVLARVDGRDHPGLARSKTEE